MDGGIEIEIELGIAEAPARKTTSSTRQVFSSAIFDHASRGCGMPGIVCTHEL